MTKKLIRIEAAHPKFLKIYYDIGNICNHKCWYCFPGSNDGTTGWPDVEKVKKNLTALIQHYFNSGVVDDIELHLLGGEPTLWPKLGEAIKYISENTKAKICILTNGSRTIRWWKENAQYFHYIGISVHHEYADVDHIIELGNLLYDKSIKFHTSVLMDHTNWDKCIGILEQLKATKKRWVVLTKAVHLGGVPNYDEKQTRFLEKQIKRFPALKYWLKFIMLKKGKFKAFFDDGSVVTTKNDTYFFLNRLNHYYGWECSLGINHLFIMKDGRIGGGCQQKLYGIDGYYNLYDDDFESKFSPKIEKVICEQIICPCSGEAALTKRKI